MREHPTTCTCGRCAAERTLLEHMLDPEAAARGPLTNATSIEHASKRDGMASPIETAQQRLQLHANFMDGVLRNMLRALEPSEALMALTPWRAYLGQVEGRVTEWLPYNHNVIVMDLSKVAGGIYMELDASKRWLVVMTRDAEQQLLAKEPNREHMLAQAAYWAHLQMQARGER